MTTEQYFKNLEVPDHPIDVVLDTDAYNEIDDQFAIAYPAEKPRQAENKRLLCRSVFQFLTPPLRKTEWKEAILK